MYEKLGTRLRRAREAWGQTQDQLAKAVGLSGRFISSLECGRRKPSLETLTALAGYLKKNISYFLEEEETAFDVLLSQEKISGKTKQVLQAFKKRCEDYIYLEEKTGRRVDLAPLYTDFSPEWMAEEERRRIGLGQEPVYNIFSLLEVNGLHLIRLPVPPEANVSGVFLFLEAEQAAFALVNSSLSEGLQKLDAVHLYGHFLRDRHEGPIIDNPDIFVTDYLSLYHPRERFAQTFASRFLMPPLKVKEVVEKDLRRKQLFLEDVLGLKRYFGVSFLAMLQTLQDLGLLSRSQFKEYQQADADKTEKDFFGNVIIAEKAAQRAGKPVISDRFRSLARQAARQGKD